MQGHFEGKKHAIRQTQDGWVVSFVVHPNDMTPEFAASALGTRLMIGYSEIGDDEQPVTTPAAKPVDVSKSERGKEQYRAMDEMEQARVRSVQLCKDLKFQLWASRQMTPGSGFANATEWLRGVLGIKSRSYIASDQHAYERFLALELAYKQAMGLAAEAR